MTPVRSVARLFLAAIFVKGGIDAVRNPDPLVDPAKPLVDQVAPALDAVGLPTDPRTFVRLNGAAQVAGGLLLATGNATRPAAALLAGTLIPTTLAGHPFWATEDPAERRNQQIHFMKNVGLFGGLLLAASDTAGRPGLAWRAGHLAGHAQDSLRRAASTTTRETRRAAKATTREARRAAKATARETLRAAEDARRTARTTARETRLAVRAAQLGRRLPG